MVTMLGVNEAVGVLDNALVVGILKFWLWPTLQPKTFLGDGHFSAKFTALGIQAGAAPGPAI